MITSEKENDNNTEHLETDIKITELPIFQKIENISENIINDDFSEHQNSDFSKPHHPQSVNFSNTASNLKPKNGVLKIFSTSSSFITKKQINLQHVVNGNKNLNIVILHPNSPENSPLSKPINSEKVKEISKEVNLTGDDLNHLGNFEQPSPTIRDELEDYYRNNHPFYTSGMKTLGNKKSTCNNKNSNFKEDDKNPFSKFNANENKQNEDKFSEKSVSDYEIKPRLSILDKEEQVRTNRKQRKNSEHTLITRDIVKHDITELIDHEENRKVTEKQANGYVGNKNLENVKVLGLGGPVSFNFDPQQVRRYKRKDLNKAKLFFKYRYVTQKLIETNNLIENKIPEVKLSNRNYFSNKNILQSYEIKDSCYYYSSDDKNVIKFICLFLRKIEKAIFIFNLKKYLDSFNYMKESNIIKNEEEFAEILLSFSGFDKYTIGEFLSKEKIPNENNRITKYFIKKMDFQGEYFLDSFRYLLSRINLPKDSGLILKIIQVFSDAYFKDNCQNNFNSKFEDVTAVYLLASTILAINTIFHTNIPNANIRLISKEEFKKMNKGVNSYLSERIYDEIKINKLDVIHDYNELIYRRLEAKSDDFLAENNKQVNYYLENKQYINKEIFGKKSNPKSDLNLNDINSKNSRDKNRPLTGEEMIKMLKKGEIFQIYCNKTKTPDVKFVNMSKDEKLIVLKPITCAFLNREKSMPTEKLSNVYIGTSNSQLFDKFDIPPAFELNCLSILGGKISIGLRHEDEKIIKSWYRALKYLIKRAKSAWEVENKKIKELSNRKEIISDFWRTEILPNWSQYRKYLLVKGELNCQIRFFTNNEIYKKFTDSVEKKNRLVIEEKEKANVGYMWFLGIPDWLRKKLWSLVISNNLNINENLFNFFLNKNEEIEFFGDTAIDRRNLRDSPQNLDELKIIGEMDGIPIYNESKIVEVGHNPIDHPLLNEIIMDVHKSFKKFEIAIRDANIEEKKFKDDLFKTLRSFTNYRPDINYSRPIAYISTVLYLNSEDFFNAFILCCNFIIPSFLTRFYTKDEVFIKYRIQFFSNLIKTHVPAVFNHFKNLDISPDLFFYDWVENLFTKTFCYESCLRIWDCYLVKGEVFVYEVGLGIIKLQEQDIINSTIRGILTNLCNFASKYTEDDLFEIIEKIDITNEYNLLIQQNNLAGEKIELYAAYLDD